MLADMCVFFLKGVAWTHEKINWTHVNGYLKRYILKWKMLKNKKNIYVEDFFVWVLIARLTDEII
jgi:hypothetical protein